MRRTFTALLAVVTLAATAGRAPAGPAGRSYSSGGSSFSGGRSASVGGSRSNSPPAGRSYSSGGKTSPAVPSGGKTAPAPPSAGKTSPAAPAGAARPSPPPAGGKTSPAPAPTKPSGPPPAGKIPAAPPVAPGRDASLGGAPRTNGRTYSSGGAAQAPAGGKPGPTGGYDAAAGAAQRRQESKEAFTRGTQPKPTYTDGKGQVQPIDPRDARIAQLRRQLDEERLANRQAREQQYFEPYTSRPVVVYHDPYNSFFWWWLLDQSLDQRAMWAYNHQADMDPARYQDLLGRDRLLEARVRELEARNQPRDPTYEPPGLDPDLAYSDAYVKAAYNPQPQPQPQPVPVAPPRHGHGMMVLTILLVLLLLGAVVWMVFFKRWNVS